MSKPILWMLIGVPGSGKSTWVNSATLEEGKGRETAVLSTDLYIEHIARSTHATYNEVFQDTIKDANLKMYKDLDYALKKEQNIIWDQTNTSRKSRESKLAKIPNTYKKIGLFFPTPDEQELDRRLASRPGKNIPKGVMRNMIDCLNQPTLDEGFDEVRVVNEQGN